MPIYSGDYMKKIIILVISIILFYMLLGHVSSYVIPADAIRVRVIANSNSDYDQEIKNKVKSNLQYKMYDLLKNTKGTEEAREVINDNLSSIDDIVTSTLKKYELDHQINYGLNYFPSKEYKGVVYDEGYYESLVITIGAGKGDNWWCVLFPPLCLLEATDATSVEYTSYVKELMDKYL